MITKVLIIDDHQLFNDGLSLILKESKDFKVVGQVYDSRQALYKCQALNPDLVLVDFNMPYLDGLAVVQQLGTLMKTFKVVVISMYANSKEIALFKESGVDGYLPKTTPAKELRNILRRIMHGEQLFKSLAAEKAAASKDSFVLKYQLTKREVEIMRALKKGYTTEQTAQELNLSYFTVETHRKNINQKLNLKTRNEFYDFLNEMDL